MLTSFSLASLSLAAAISAPLPLRRDIPPIECQYLRSILTNAKIKSSLAGPARVGRQKAVTFSPPLKRRPARRRCHSKAPRLDKIPFNLTFFSSGSPMEVDTRPARWCAPQAGRRQRSIAGRAEVPSVAQLASLECAHTFHGHLLLEAAMAAPPGTPSKSPTRWLLR